MALTVDSGDGNSGSGSGASGSHRGGSTSRKPSVSIDIESIRLQLSTWASRAQSKVSIDTIRPLPMFLGIAPNNCFSPGAFTSPVKKVDKATPEKIQSRVKLNVAFFLSNYAVVAGMVAVTVALMHPGMIGFCAVVYGLWSLHSFMIRHELIMFGIHMHSLLTVQQRFYGLFVITALVLVWKCLKPLLIFISISGLLILSHAFLRDPKHIESSGDFGNDSDDEGERSGESSGSEVMVDKPPSSLNNRSGNVV